MKRILRKFWDDLLTPSPQDESLHYWATLAISHGLVGMAAFTLVALFLATTVLVSVLCIVLYVLLKEEQDLRRGGSIADTLVDTSMFGLGAFGYFIPHFPAIFLAIVGGGIVLRAFVLSRQG